MSKPMTWSNPASAAVLVMPTMPPAGPDRIASLPRNVAASVRPPFDCMKSSRPVALLKPRHDPVDIAAQHRRQISVDHRRIAAPDQLDQRLDLMARRDLGEADLLGQRLQRRLMRGPAPAVHQHDRQRADARVERRLQPGPRRLAIERLLDRPVRPHPLVDLDHPARKAAPAARSCARKYPAAPACRSSAHRPARR